eukprot:9503777-Pyramimonas_sp.AAC.1
MYDSSTRAVSATDVAISGHSSASGGSMSPGRASKSTAPVALCVASTRPCSVPTQLLVTTSRLNYIQAKLHPG